MVRVQNKTKIKKIIFTILIVLLFNFILPCYSQALLGGILIRATAYGVYEISDCVFSILQSFFFGDGSLDDGIKYTPGAIFSGRIKAFDINFISANSNASDGENLSETSLIGKLKGTVATWYKTMLEVALVGLLSVLIYISIRIIMNSSSKEKAKYKKMLFDWLVAVCILFSLHFIMSLTFKVTSAIIDILGKSVIGQEGQDTIVTGIRNDVRAAVNFDELDMWGGVFYILLYAVLAIYTFSFTVQYIKRLIYIVFLGMVSPLVALTYPLDKLKDGKSQAFDTWLKEFLFNALIQPIHLLTYFLLIFCAEEMVSVNKIYAVIAIGSMIPAEKFFRKLFGLDSDTSMGNMAAAMGGSALLSNMNKMGGSSSKKTSSESENADSTPGKIRKINDRVGNSYDALKDEEGVPSVSLSDTGGNNTPNSVSQNIEGNSSNAGNRMNLESLFSNQQEPTSSNTPIRNIKNSPAFGLVRKYVANSGTARKLAKGLVKLPGRAMLGTIGIAAGVATGDMKNVIAGGTAGVVAGGRVGERVYNRMENIKKIPEEVRKVKYGEKEYSLMEFKRSDAYHSLKNMHSGQENQIVELFEAGIKEPEEIEYVLDKMNTGKFDTKKALAYMKMAEKCPDKILYDKAKFRTYLTSYGIPEEKAEEIQKNVSSFK